MNLFRICLVATLSMQFACSELQMVRDRVIHTDEEYVPFVDDSQGVHGWLADMRQLRNQPPENLPVILDAREEAFRARPGLENRLALVMLLLIEEDSVQDKRRARLLLRGLDPLPTHAGEREFIRLLRQFLDGHHEYEQKLSVLWKQVTQQNRRIDELEQQMKALTSIEQNIQQREPPPVIENGK